MVARTVSGPPSPARVAPAANCGLEKATAAVTTAKTRQLGVRPAASALVRVSPESLIKNVTSTGRIIRHRKVIMRCASCRPGYENSCNASNLAGAHITPLLRAISANLRAHLVLVSTWLPESFPLSRATRGEEPLAAPSKG